jgi:hypothetical protein
MGITLFEIANFPGTGKLTFEIVGKHLYPGYWPHHKGQIGCCGRGGRSRHRFMTG